MEYYHIPYPSPLAAKETTAAVQSYIKTTANKTRLMKNSTLVVELRTISEAVLNCKSQYAELADWLIARLVNFWPLFEQEAKILAAKGRSVMTLLCDGITVTLEGSEVPLIYAMDTLADTSCVINSYVMVRPCSNVATITSVYKRNGRNTSQQELVGIADNTLTTIEHALRMRYIGLERDRTDGTAYDNDVFHRRLPLSITLRWNPKVADLPKPS